MTIYELGVSSATAVQLYPDFNIKTGRKQIRNEHRSKSGRLRLYKWGEYHKIKFKLEWVPAADANTINSWWRANTELLWFVTSGTTTITEEVMLLNKETPLNQYSEPYDNLLRGTLLLGVIGNGS